jgi:peptide deformylase
MATLPILLYPDPRLREKARTVTDFGPGLGAFADDLAETLHASGGIGISAPQVGDRRALLVMDLSEDGTDPQLYVNPRILAADVQALVEESCLSIPGVVGNVVRSIRIRVRAQDRRGETFERELADMSAVCLQHEVDHLEGRLFIDRLPLLRRLQARWVAGRHARETGAHPTAPAGVTG